MSLVNQNWIGLNGEPVTGRIPPRLLVMNGVQPNPQQMGMIAHHYKLLTYMMKVSVIPFLIQERHLTDGTRIRMVSSYGTDTVMVWPASLPGTSTWAPGIGVSILGAKWVLRPPGKAMHPTSDEWVASRVGKLNGGVGTIYRAGDGRYFVEGDDGTSRGNERLTGPLFGMTSSIYLYPQTTHQSVSVSDPIIFGRSLEQLKIDGNTLKCRARRLSETGIGGVVARAGGNEDVTYPMPTSDEGDYWGLLTAHSDREKIVVCRIASDMSSWFFRANNIRQSVLMWRDKGATGFDDVAVQLHTPDTSRKYPDDAPMYSRWDRSEQRKNETIYTTYANPAAGHNPNAPATITTDGVDNTYSYSYTEKCDYSCTGAFRRYVDFTGSIREDTLEYEDQSDISFTSKSGIYGFDREGYVDTTRFGGSATDVKTARTATLTLAGVVPLKIHEFILDLEDMNDEGGRYDMKFSEYIYNSAGGIKGYFYAGSASAAMIRSADSSIQYAMERVLVHDSQFGVAATVRVFAKTTTHTAQGYPRISAASPGLNDDDEAAQAYFDNVYALAVSTGDGRFPLSSYINVDTRTDELTVEMNFYAPGGKETVTVAVPPTVHAELLHAMNLLVIEASTPSNRGDLDPDVDSGVRQNDYRHEQDVHEVLEKVLGYVTEASYAKDPKTGAGFFSCVWDDGVSPEVRRNKVVGPWGWAAASSKTPIADDAKVLSITSV